MSDIIKGNINWAQGKEVVSKVPVIEKVGRTLGISAKIIADSTSYLHRRLTTFILEYPRYIHSELMTHRVFSKNSASSRAIPFEKFVKMVELSPVKPLWTINQAGMQGPVITDPGSIMSCDRIWLEARDSIVGFARKLSASENIHKQNVNRLLEPWMHIRIVLTGTDFSNWFELRDHKDAHPEIHELARMMKFAFVDSVPKFLNPGDWHIPFGDRVEGVEDEMWCGDNILKSSVARCARVSYDNFEPGSISSIGKDLILFDKLITNRPLHASPAEHQARVPIPSELAHMSTGWHYGNACLEEQEEWTEKRGKYYSNLGGWIQLRKLIECGEFV